jgi:hypothetical protein
VNGIIPKKPSFGFQKFTSNCSEACPKTMTKTGKNKYLANLGKMASNISLILPNHDTCVKNERGFCEWACSQQKPLSVFKNSPPVVQKAHRKPMTKTGKNKVFQKIRATPFDVSSTTFDTFSVAYCVSFQDLFLLL